MENHLKRKIRRLWRYRALLGVGALALMGFSAMHFKAALSHRPQQPSWVVELSKAVETLSSEETSQSTTYMEQAQDLVSSISQQKELIVTEYLIENQIRDSAHGLTQERILRRSWIPSQVSDRAQELDLALEMDLALDLAQALDLTQALDLAQDLTQELDRLQYRAQSVDLAEAQALAEALAVVLDRILALDRAYGQGQAQAQALAQNLDRILALDRARPQDRSQIEELAQVQAQHLMWVQELALELVQTRAVFLQSLLLIVVTEELKQVHGLSLQQGSALDDLLENEPARARMFMQSVIFVTISGLLLIALLLALVRLRGAYRLPSTAHLIACLPEEYVAEFGVLKTRMQEGGLNPWQIRLRLLSEFMTLLWIFYIQVQIENLILPPGDNEIDD